MCGIIVYTGYTDARGKLIKGLKTLEYRGYDSAGIAVFNDTLNEVIVAKCEGRVERLDEKSKDIKGNTGIGHTRWATHGGVSDSNSHPHKFGFDKKPTRYCRQTKKPNGQRGCCRFD